MPDDATDATDATDPPPAAAAPTTTAGRPLPARGERAGGERSIPKWGDDPETALSKERRDALLALHAAQARVNARILAGWRGAARAYRQLASVLREQGMSDEADRIAYQGQVCQRRVYRRAGQRGRWLGALLLDLISGYGYRPRRSLVTYVGVIVVFAAVYFALRASVSPALTPLDALVFSVTSFHGRGFSPGEVITLHNPLTVLAAGEAILGLLIEITFIATFTQRFFGK